MRRARNIAIAIISVALISGACRKGPGIGGQASLKGNVSGVLYDKKFITKIDSGGVGNWTVNILFGDDIAIDGNQKTSYDGTFNFQYLRTGHYRVFVYSRAHKTNLADSAIVVEADITGDRQELVLPAIHIFH